MRWFDLSKTLAFVTVAFGVSSQTLGASPLHVVLDPGHGGSDSGAVNGELKESEIVLSVAQELAKILNQDSRFKVTLTRTKDELLTLDYRSAIARKVGADVFLSIHLNSAVQSKPKGTEFYIQNQFPPDEESLFLANRENRGAQVKSRSEEENEVQTILGDLKRSHDVHLSLILAQQFKKNWPSPSSIRQGPFHVLFEAQTPSTLIELGFLSHPEEGPWLAKPETHRVLAQRIWKALITYKERLDKKRTKSL